MKKKTYSVTRKTDEERALYDKLDLQTPVIDISRADVTRLRCKACGMRPQTEVSAYAFSKSDKEILVYCLCPHKRRWLKLKD